MQVQAKQISKVLAGWVALTNQTVSNANSLAITSALTTALATAGNNSTSVPLNANGSYNTEGVIVGSSAIVPIYSYPAGQAIEQGGFEIYGVLTYSSSVYTVSFYYNNATGTQTAATLNQAINLLVPYAYTFNDFPFSAILAATNADPGGMGGAGTALYVDTGISVTGTNTISNLTKLPANGSNVILFVNGQALASGVGFTVSGQAVTLSSTNISNNGYSITTTDNIFAVYAV